MDLIWRIDSANPATRVPNKSMMMLKSIRSLIVICAWREVRKPSIARRREGNDSEGFDPAKARWGIKKFQSGSRRSAHSGG